MNHRELERDYWLAMRVANARVLIVDNASNPPLPNALRSETNLGFSAGCNLGLANVRTDAVLFLNNDICATETDWLSNIEGLLEPGVLVGANLRYEQHGNVDDIQLPYLDGWCLAGMTEDLRELGGWDEGFDEPSYYGDNDLCFRARLAGMTLKQADVGLEHLANRTAGPGDDLLVRRATTANYQRFAARVREEMEIAA